MNAKTIIGLIAGGIALVFIVFGLAVLFKTQKDIASRQLEINKSLVEMKQIGDGIVRSQAQYVSKDDLEKFSKELGLNMTKINADMNTLGAKVEGINNVLVTTSGFHGTGLSSGGIVPRGPTSQPIDLSNKYGYFTNMQIFPINEPLAGESVPFGRTTFSAWQEKPWGLDIYPRNYSVSTVIGQDAEGRHYTYNKFTVAAQGKTYIVPIKESKFEEEFPKSSFMLNPRIYLGVGGGVRVNPLPAHAEFTPTLSTFLFSYGRTKMEAPDWAAVGVGIGYETQINRPALAITPITWNVGKRIPLLNNLHIASTVTVDTKGSFGILAGVHVGL